MKRIADKLQDQLQNMINILDQFNTLYSATSRYGNKDVESLDAEAERLQLEFSRLMRLYVESKSGEVTRRYLDRVDRADTPGQLDRIKRKMQIHAKLSPTEQNAMSQYHIVDPVATRDRIREHRQFSRDLREEIAPILEHNRRITGQEF